MNFTCIIAAAHRAHLRRALWLAIVCAIAPASIEAQEPATSRLRLSDVYRDAQSANPRFAAARARARAANARISAAGLPPDPELQLGFMNYSLPDLEPMDPLGMTQLQLMQMVPIGGKLHLSKNIARAQASASGFRATDAGWEVRGEVAMAFYDLYRTDRGLDVARGTIRLLQDVRSIAESMYRVGEGRQADVLRAQVELARMIEDTVRMTTMRTGMAARLNAVLDRPFDAVVSPPLLPVFPDTIPALDSLVMLAEAERPMVKAGEVELEAANAQLKLARREIWPDLTVGLQYGQRRGEMGLERMGSLMVGASIPVFARSRQLRMREEAAAMREMAAADLTAMRADTRARVTEAYANLVRARNLAALYRTTILPQAEATVSSALAAYRAGSVDFMTLLDSRMTVNAYLQELLALDAEQGKVWAELEMLTGRELFDANATAAERAGRETR